MPVTTVTLLHYNDIYNIESRVVEPVGGAARFKTATAKFDHLQPLTVFSGDVFSPSVMSTYTRGHHMPAVLNLLGTQVAVYGNHDFDQGLENTLVCKEACQFPWLMANVTDLTTGRPLGEGIPSVVIPWQGRKIGFTGLVEPGWIDTLGTVDPKMVEYQDFITVGTAEARRLREEEGCDAVIALTHMRTHNDLRLADSEADFDLILAGHDHDYQLERSEKTGRLVVKSGTDFRSFSLVHLAWAEGELRPVVEVEKVDVTAEYEEDEQMMQLCQSHVDALAELLAREIGTLGADLDGRRTTVRSQESNLGNLVADIMLANANADCALIQGGNFRSDQVHAAGPFTLRDLNTIFAYNDACVLVEVTGGQLAAALENGVSTYPVLDGRFLQVSGISFLLDASKPPGERVDPDYIKVGGAFLCLESTYRVASVPFVALEGKRGFGCMLPNTVILTEDEAPAIPTLVQNHFASVAAVRALGAEAPAHRQSLVLLSRREGVVRQFLGRTGRGAAPLRSLSRQGSLHLPVVTIGALEQESLGVAPRVEGRIVVATAELRAAWDRERELLDWATARLGAKGRFLGEKLKQVRANFALFDRDGDGLISRQELEAALQDQGVAAGKEELDRVWNGVDKNGDGTIDFQEFIDLMSDNLEVTDTELLEAFQKFDVDSNGGLSAGEVLTVLRSVGVWVGEGQVAEMMVAADLDQSGDISYQELVHYMRTL